MVAVTTVAHQILISAYLMIAKLMDLSLVFQNKVSLPMQVVKNMPAISVNTVESKKTAKKTSRKKRIKTLKDCCLGKDWMKPPQHLSAVKTLPKTRFSHRNYISKISAVRMYRLTSDSLLR